MKRVPAISRCPTLIVGTGLVAHPSLDVMERGIVELERNRLDESGEGAKARPTFVEMHHMSQRAFVPVLRMQ